MAKLGRRKPKMSTKSSGRRAPMKQKKSGRRK